MSPPNFIVYSITLGIDRTIIVTLWTMHGEHCHASFVVMMSIQIQRHYPGTSHLQIADRESGCRCFSEAV
ncbi:hypothetical protein [Glaciimonas soli]|uniref:hypothetical protein n=1 Tax=Glaciimonas soli TaxID=2590999 RepID=UPI001D174285|nr:hypothetical protein [Glaciimonas soli]